MEGDWNKGLAIQKAQKVWSAQNSWANWSKKKEEIRKVLLFIFRISYFCSRGQLVGHKAFIVESGFLVVVGAQFVCHLCRWTLGCRYPPSVTTEQLINEHGSASQTPDCISICALKGREMRKKQPTQPKPEIKARKEVWKLWERYYLEKKNKPKTKPNN